MLRLIVDFEQMQHELTRMSDLSDEYRQLYGTLLMKVDESSQYWKGKDQEAFLSKIYAFEKDFDLLHEWINQYILFINKSMQAYRMCQDEAEAMSLRL